MERTFHMLLYRAFHAQRSYLRPCLGEIGLVVGQPKLITYLACHGPCGQRELAEYFEVDSAAVSRMVDSLEKGGFITRRPMKPGGSDAVKWRSLCLTGSVRKSGKGSPVIFPGRTETSGDKRRAFYDGSETSSAVPGTLSERYGHRRLAGGD